MAFDRNGSALGRQVFSRDSCRRRPELRLCAAPRRRAGRRQGQIWRLGNALRNAARRRPRSMRPDAERRRRGQAQRQSRGDRAEDGRRQEPAAARHRAARRAAAVRPRPQGRPGRHRPRRFRALPAVGLHRRSGDGGQADRAVEHRDHRHLHHFPDAGGRHRHSAERSMASRTVSKNCPDGRGPERQIAALRRRTANLRSAHDVGYWNRLPPARRSTPAISRSAAAWSISPAMPCR